MSSTDFKTIAAAPIAPQFTFLTWPGRTVDEVQAIITSTGQIQGRLNNPTLASGQPNPQVAAPPTANPRPSTVVCPILEILPPELRLHVYKELLVSPKIIRGGELVEDKLWSTIVRDQLPPGKVLNIDSTFLRTCSTIYNEALPVLYQHNWFGFTEVIMLRSFRTKGLPTGSNSVWSCADHRDGLCHPHQVPAPRFVFRPEVQGRLCLVRKLHLRFRHSQQAIAIRGWLPGVASAQFDPRQGIDQWSAWLNEERYHDPAGFVTFPELVELVLDFS